MAEQGIKIIAVNRKARYDYELLEQMEAGMVLQGTEVKSIRQGKVTLKDAYAVVRQGELFLLGMHISPYEQGNRFNHEPERKRKLLMHRREINRLEARLAQDGLSLLPTKLYFSKGRVKLTLALGRGKKRFDKRQSIAGADAKRAIERALKNRH